MKTKTMVILVLAVSLAAGLYFLFQESGPGLIKIVFAYLLVILSLCLCYVLKLDKSQSVEDKVLKNLEGIERLLLDIRDGTKKFYMERRSSPRIKERILAKIIGDNANVHTEIVNISYEGALLRTAKEYAPGDTLDLNLYLPLYPQPINVAAKVLKLSPLRDAGTSDPYFEIGVEFLSFGPEDKEKLVETVDILKKRTVQLEP